MSRNNIKRILFLIKLWSENRSLPKLVVVGDGPLRAAVENAAKDDNRIDYSMGYTGDNQMPKPPKYIKLDIDNEYEDNNEDENEDDDNDDSDQGGNDRDQRKQANQFDRGVNPFYQISQQQIKNSWTKPS